jgi:hypothetical protein
VSPLLGNRAAVIIGGALPFVRNPSPAVFALAVRSSERSRRLASIRPNSVILRALQTYLSGLFVLTGRHFALRIASSCNSSSPRAIAEQQMTGQPHFKTADVERSDRAQAKKRAIEDRKRLAMIDGLQRTRQRTEAVLMDLKNTAILLDYSIESELQSSPTRDPRHFAFPMTARALISRRDNLRATIAALSEELARGSHLERSVA